MGQNLKDVSRSTFSLVHSSNPTLEEIKTSCLMRIADANENQAKYSEMLALKYIQMEKDLNYFKNGYERLKHENEHLKKSQAALRGAVTRMKNKNL